MRTIIEKILEAIGAWFVLAVVAALAIGRVLHARQPAPVPRPRAHVIDLTERIRQRDARLRGAVHHPFADPVVYSSVDELMPGRTVEVD